MKTRSSRFLDGWTEKMVGFIRSKKWLDLWKAKNGNAKNGWTYQKQLAHSGEDTKYRNLHQTVTYILTNSNTHPFNAY